MEWVLALSIPGLVVLLVVVATVESISRRKGGLPATAAGLEDFAGVFQASRRVDQDHKRHSLMMRDELGDGAPPRSAVDLDAGTARLVIPPVQER